MKNQIIISGILFLALVMSAGLQAQTKTDIESSLKWDKKGLLEDNKALLVSGRDVLINKWNKDFALAKTFVVNNSKNLVGTMDPDITKALNMAEEASNGLVSTIKSLREIKPYPESKNPAVKPEVDKIRGLRNRLEISMNELRPINMILPNKKEAQEIVLLMGNLLDSLLLMISNWFWEIK